MAVILLSDLKVFWTRTPDALCSALSCTQSGLKSEEAEERLRQVGPNSDGAAKRVGLFQALGKRMLEPLSLILIAAGVVSIGTGDVVGGSIIVVILAVSVSLDTLQERHAVKAAEMLRRSVALNAEVKRDGAFKQVPVEEVVPGDVVRVRAGDMIPADALVLNCTAFTAGEAALTGEPYPVEKRAGTVTALNAGEAINALFRGSVAQTGEAVALVVGTGPATLFGSAASILTEDSGQSPFQRDLHDYGVLTARLAIALVLVVMTAHLFFGRPILESLLFSAALAVGLTPELLPMITTVTLTRGAMRMAKRKVIVKRLAAIHDLGAMTIFCTDKTGTLTSAEIVLADSLGPTGADDPRAAQLGAIAADLGGDRGAMDAALVAGSAGATEGWSLISRRAFDFTRRIGSVLAAGPNVQLLIAKGAPEALLPLCTSSRGGAMLGAADRQLIIDRIAGLASQGLRTIAVASKPWFGAPRDIKADDEADLVFEGLCAFADPPKPTAAAAIARLAVAGIQLKILSGDDPLVVKRLAALVGLKAETVLSGSDIAALSDDALAVKVQSIDAFGRLAPDQKSRIVKALQSRGAIVGYLGDGINDAPALKTADIGLSVEGASGIAQAVADMILLASDLNVVADGVEEGRRTFVNILKYVRMGASSNFGNMLSMAAASLFLPFLPMLPTQILLNNLLYDFSEIGIPFDTVRPAATSTPQVWNMGGIIRFAAIMGPLSSLFDFATFAGLIFLFHVSADEFRTTWFLESMATQILVIFVIRTNGRPWKDLPHPALTVSSLAALVVAMGLPFTVLGHFFGFETPPPQVLFAVAGLAVVYLVAAEAMKRWASSRHSDRQPEGRPTRA